MTPLAFGWFVPLPIELMMLVWNGVLTFREFCLLCVLISEAKRAGDTGVLRTSASALSSRWSGLSYKTAVRALASLEAKGFIRRYGAGATNQPFLLAIHGYIRQNDGIQHRLDAAQTPDPNYPRWAEVRSGKAQDLGTQVDTHLGSQVGSEVGSQLATSRLQKKKRKKNTPRTASPDADASAGEDAEAPAPGARAAAPKPTPSTSESIAGAKPAIAPQRRLIDLWKELTSAKGLGVEPKYGRHAKVFTELLAAAHGDLDRCDAALRAFFATEDPFSVKLGFSIGAFQTHMRGLLIAVGDAAPRTAHHTTACPSPNDEPPATTEAAAAFAADAMARMQKRRGAP